MKIVIVAVLIIGLVVFVSFAMESIVKIRGLGKVRYYGNPYLFPGHPLTFGKACYLIRSFVRINLRKIKWYFTPIKTKHRINKARREKREEIKQKAIIQLRKYKEQEKLKAK